MRIALYQCPSLPGDVAANLARLRTRAAEAAADGARLLVTPEMFLSGYNIGPQAAAALAEPRDGTTAQAVAEIARDTRVAILYGYPERGPDGLVYNAVRLVERDGTALADYRKTHLYGDLDRTMFSPGSDTVLVDLDGWRLGLLVCYDVEFPETVRALALAGADLVVVPTANMTPYEFVAEVIVRARAYENQVYLAYANYCGSEGDVDYCGLSSLSAPDGTVPAVAGLEESLLLVDVDRDALTASRAVVTYLADRRPGLDD